MLKTILALGTGVALGCYYKSHKDKTKSLEGKKDSEANLNDNVDGTKEHDKFLK